MHIQHRSSEFPSVFQGWFFCPLGQVFLKIKHGLQLFPRKVQELVNEDLCYHNCISVLLTQLLTSLFFILLWINCSLTDISACVLYGQEVVTHVLVCKEFSVQTIIVNYYDPKTLMTSSCFSNQANELHNQM